MKKFFIIIAVFVLTVQVSGQFFRPVPKTLFSEVTVDSKAKGNSIWLFRPAVTLTAVQWNYKDGMFSANAFQSAGLGVGYQHFVATSETDLTPFNNYGANLLLLLGTDVSVAGTFTGFGILNLGVLYNFTLKVPGILCGVQVKF